MSSSPVPRLDTDVSLNGTNVTVLMGKDQGKYPTSNSMMVVGTESALLTDPSIDVHTRGGVPANIDRILVSHAHEDHIAGIGQFPHCTLNAHHHDVAALQHIESFLDVYGMPEPARTVWKVQIENDFNYAPRPDATGFNDGDRFDLGGTTVTVVHLPGHTRGHSGFLVDPDGVFFVADIDLSRFGPYYGDHWSDLEDFERAMDKAAEIDARWYVTSHHKGIVEGRPAFLEALAAFRSVINNREQRLLAFLQEPKSMAEMVAHRIIYRPGTTGLIWIDHVEQTSISMHLTRLIRDGAIVEVESDRFRAA